MSKWNCYRLFSILPPGPTKGTQNLIVDYKDEINEYFEPYSNHEAGQLCQEMVNNGFTYDAPPAFVLCHSNLPDFTQEHSYPSHVVNRAGSKYKLAEFADAMRDFAVESNFQDFFDNHQSNYNEIVENIESNLGDHNYIELMEDYYGNYKEGYALIIAPLFHAGGYTQPFILMKVNWYLASRDHWRVTMAILYLVEWSGLNMWLCTNSVIRS